MPSGIMTSQGRLEPASSSETETLLDILPENVCERIAAFASRGRQTSTTLNLARVSATQCDAVVHALRRTFVMKEPSALPWAETFNGLARGISVEGLENEPEEVLLKQLRSPYLRRARIPATGPLLLALKEGGTVEELTVLLSERNYAEFLDTLGALPIKKLSICDFPIHDAFISHGACASGLFHSYGADAVAKRCPKLETFDFRCYCPRYPSMVEVFASFANLREVTLTKVPTWDSLPILRRMESVKLIGVYNGFECASQIGSSVTWYEEEDYPLVTTADKLLQLRDCNRLEYVKFWIGWELDVAVAELVSSLPRLRALYLRWTPRFISGQHRPEEGFILRMVQGAMHLEELGAVGVVISSEELRSVLSYMGARLRRFETSIVSQDELPHERLALLLMLLARYNPGLEDLSVYNGGLVQPFDGSEEDRLVQLKLLRTCKEVLLCRNPSLDERKVDDCIEGSLATIAGVRYV